MLQFQTPMKIEEVIEKINKRKSGWNTPTT